MVQNQHCHKSPAITRLRKITQFPSTLSMSASGLVISFELLVVLIWPGFSVQLISFYCLLLRGRFKKIFCNSAVPRSADFISSSNQHASLVLPCPCPTHITPADVLSVKSTYISFLMISQHIYCVQLWEIKTSQLYRTTDFTNRPLPEYIETWFILFTGPDARYTKYLQRHTRPEVWVLFTN